MRKSRKHIKNRRFIIIDNSDLTALSENRHFITYHTNVYGLKIFKHLDDALSQLTTLRLNVAKSDYSIVEVINDEKDNWFTEFVKIKGINNKTTPKYYFKRVTDELVKL